MVDEMRMMTACVARALQRCTSHLSKHFLLTFQEVTPLSKTRNQLIGCCSTRLQEDKDRGNYFRRSPGAAVWPNHRQQPTPFSVPCAPASRRGYAAAFGRSHATRA